MTGYGASSLVADMTLSDWLDAAPLTRTQIADLLGVHRVTLFGYERGDSMPRPAIVEKIRSVTKGEVTARDLVDTYNARQAERAACS